MIFSADLDRTLIFSPRRLDPLGPATIPVERRQGAPCGFMTPEARRALMALSARATFFLNTLRGLEQANRVDFVSEGRCRYLALQNGLSLYRDGVEDRDWAAHVKRTVSTLPLDLTGGIERVLRHLPGIECLSKRYQYLAVFFVEESLFDGGACDMLADELAGLGWALCRQRKKLYLSPQPIHKGAVLARVREREDGAEAVGFGDSGFDLPMLRACRTAWSLRDCDLWGRDWGFPIQYSSTPAQAGTQEVLQRILSNLGDQKLC